MKKSEKFKVVITDYTDYKEGKNTNGGGYSYTTVYSNIDDNLDLWNKVELSSAEFPYCRDCGRFFSTTCCCGGEEIKVKYEHLEEEVRKALFEEHKEVEFFIGEKDLTDEFIEAYGVIGYSSFVWWVVS